MQGTVVEVDGRKHSFLIAIDGSELQIQQVWIYASHHRHSDSISRFQDALFVIPIGTPESLAYMPQPGDAVIALYQESGSAGDEDHVSIFGPGKVVAYLEDRSSCIVRFWNGSTMTIAKEHTYGISEEHYQLAARLLE